MTIDSIPESFFSVLHVLRLPWLPNKQMLARGSFLVCVAVLSVDEVVPSRDALEDSLEFPTPLCNALFVFWYLLLHTTTTEPMAATQKLSVQIWSDIACPWCLVGKRNFETALRAFPLRDRITVQFRSFQLDPSLPEDGKMNILDYLEQRKGMPKQQVTAAMERLGEVGKALGFKVGRSPDPAGVSLSNFIHWLLSVMRILSTCSPTCPFLLAEAI